MTEGTTIPPGRVNVVPGLREVPPEEVIEARFTGAVRGMRANLSPGRLIRLGHDKEWRIKHLARRAHGRRRSEAGIAHLAAEQVDRLVPLIRGGAALPGPQTAHEIDELIAALHAQSPWMAEVSAALMRDMRAHRSAGCRGFSVGPTILVGPPGTGKSHYARRLARIAGVPHRLIDVGSGTAAFRIAGLERGWRSAEPGLPVETVIAHRIANPVMIVDEIDKAGAMAGGSNHTASLSAALLAMLDPGTSSRFECPALRVVFDLGRVNWILTANDTSTIPQPVLDRCRVLRMPEMTPAVAGQMFDVLTADVDFEADLRRHARTFIQQAAGQRPDLSLRGIHWIVDLLRHQGRASIH